jgi:uncharacterized membrane protein
MAYTKHGLGDIMSTAKAAAAIARDPYLPEVVQLVLELERTEDDQGVGLHNVVGPLRTFVKIQKKPWVLPVIAIGLVGGIFALGYYTGKVTK